MSSEKKREYGFVGVKMDYEPRNEEKRLIPVHSDNERQDGPCSKTVRTQKFVSGNEL